MKNLLTYVFLIFTLAGFSQGTTITIGDKVDNASNADSLDGKLPAFFVDTATVQNVFGIKNFKTGLTTKILTLTPKGSLVIDAPANTIFANNSRITVTPDADYVLTSTPTIPPGIDGQLITIHNESPSFSIDLQDKSILTGSGIILNGAEGALKPKGTMMLQYCEVDTAWAVVSNPNQASAGATANLVDVRNVSGTAISAGKAVYITGFNVGQNRITIDLADADDLSKMPSIGLTATSIGDGANGQIVAFGSCLGKVNTSTAAVNDGVYVDTIPGELIFIRPDLDHIQKIGIVTRVNSSGNILIYGAGRTNDIPIDLTVGIITADSINVDSINIQSQLSFDNGATITNTETDTLFLTETIIRLAGKVILDNYLRHHDITISSATLGPNVPTATTVGTFRGLGFDADNEAVYFVIEIPPDWNAVSDMTLVVHWFSTSGDIIANGETVKWDASYRSIAEGEAVDNGTVVVATGTFTGGASEIDKEHYQTPLTIVYSGGNQPLVAGDDIGFQFDRDVSGDTYSGAGIVYKVDLVYYSNTVPQGD